MNRSRLSARGRWGAAILGVSMLLAGTLAAAPYVWRSALAEQLAEKRNEVRLLAARIDASKDQRRAAIAAGDNYDALFVNGATPGLAMASLQRLVTEIATKTGMELQRTQALQADGKDGANLLRMEAEATGNIAALRDFLLALETGAPLLFVSAAKVSVSPTAAADDTSLPADRLTVALRIEAYGEAGGKP